MPPWARPPHIDEALRAIDKMTLELVKHLSAWKPWVYFKGYTPEMFAALEGSEAFTLPLYRLYDLILPRLNRYKFVSPTFAMPPASNIGAHASLNRPFPVPIISVPSSGPRIF